MGMRDIGIFLIALPHHIALPIYNIKIILNLLNNSGGKN